MEGHDRPGSDRPMKQAKTESHHDDEEDAQAPGDEVDALALSFQATLGFGTFGTGLGEGGTTPEHQQIETSPLLHKMMTYLATSADLVQTRATCRAFLPCSDRIAVAQTRKLIGNSVKPMVGQSIVGLLKGAENANEYTRAKLSEWNAEAGQAAGISVGLPTLPIHRTEDSSGHLFRNWDVIALISNFDSDVPGCLVPIRVKFAQSPVAPVVGLPEGFFHPRVKNSGLIERVYRGDAPLLATIQSTISFLDREKQYQDRWRGSGITNRTHPCMAYDISCFCDETTYNQFLMKCLNIFVGYQLGEPIPCALKPFQEECLELINRMRRMMGGEALPLEL